MSLSISCVSTLGVDAGQETPSHGLNEVLKQNLGDPCPFLLKSCLQLLQIGNAIALVDTASKLVPGMFNGTHDDYGEIIIFVGCYVVSEYNL